MAKEKKRKIKKTQWFEFISEYLDIPLSWVEPLIKAGPDLVAADWNAINPQTDQEIEAFYKSNKSYIFDLIGWHLWGPKKGEDKEFMKRIKKPGKVLDYGCGAGFLALNLARKGHKVTLMDFDNPPFRFAMFVAEQLELDCEFVTVKHVEENFADYENNFEYILCLDVLEHAPKPLKICQNINKLLSKNGKVLINAPFGKTEDHPMHLELSEKAKEGIRLIANKIIVK